MQNLLSEIAQTKAEIEAVRADLTSKHEEQSLGLESQIKILRQKLAELEDEENTMKKIGKQQRKALGHFQIDKEKINPQVEQLQKESSALGVKVKELKVKLSQRQIEWKNAHEQMVALELKCRAAQQSLNAVEVPQVSENEKELLEWNKKVSISGKSHKHRRSQKREKVRRVKNPLN